MALLQQKNAVLYQLALIATMFCPLLAVLLVQKVFLRQPVGIGWKVQGKRRFWLAAWFGPAVFTLLGAVLYFAVFPSRLDFSCSWLVAASGGAMDAQTLRSELGVSTPVSYTHLDVYKRQFQACAIDLEKRKPVFNNIFAGLSGPAVRPIALRMVWQAVGAVNIPVVGLGGIATGRDALEFIMAGATAVQVGAANVANPRAMETIADEMAQWMDAHGVKTLEEIRGCARNAE